MSSLSQQLRSEGAEPPLSWKTALIASVIAFVAATIVTVIAFYIVDAAGMIPDNVPIKRFGGEESKIVAGDVVGTMASAFVPATIVLLLLARFSSKPRRLFTIIGVVYTIISFVLPIVQIEDAPAKMVIGLNILHVIAAAVVIGLVLMLTDPEKSPIKLPQ